MMNVYDVTSIDTIVNDLVSNTGANVVKIGHVEVPFTAIKVTLVGYYHHRSNKSTLIGDSITGETNM